jgi:hypothetical protein
MESGGILHSMPEKSPLAFLITGAAVVAFAASNLFVFGVSIALHQDLALHFEILDYVRITPDWALPASLYYGVVTLFILIIKVWTIATNRPEATTIRSIHHPLPSPIEILFLALVLPYCFWMGVRNKLESESSGDATLGSAPRTVSI